MPTYKLTYFNITGLGEPLRFMLSHGGADFVDDRIEFADWPQRKSEMPMEQVPIVEIDGKVYHQTRAIGRYLAKKFNLYGADELEAIEIDATVDDIEDYRMHISRFFREEDATFKAKLKDLAIQKGPFFLGKLESQAKKNGGYFVGNKLSWADVHFSAIAELIGNILEKDILQNYPTLKKLNEIVRTLPKIKAYLDKRPKTAY